LLEGAGDASTFLAFFLADRADEPVGEHDAAFRARL